MTVARQSEHLSSNLVCGNETKMTSSQSLYTIVTARNSVSYTHYNNDIPWFKWHAQHNYCITSTKLDHNQTQSWSITWYSSTVIQNCNTRTMPMYRWEHALWYNLYTTYTESSLKVNRTSLPHLLIQPVTTVKLMLHAVLASIVALGTEDIAIALCTLPQNPSR